MATDVHQKWHKASRGPNTQYNNDDYYYSKENYYNDDNNKVFFLYLYLHITTIFDFCGA